MFPDFDPENPNYCKAYACHRDNNGEPVFDKDQPQLTCQGDVQYAYAPFEMANTVATENNLVGSV